MAGEQERLLEKMPVLKDPEKASRIIAKNREYLVKQAGFSHEEVDQAYDHRMVVLAHKARLFDEGQVRAQSAKQKVEAAPAMVTPQARRAPVTAKQAARKEAMGRLAKTGKPEDAIFAILS